MRILKWTSAVVLLCVLFVAGSLDFSGNRDDPKSVRYLLWKHGLYKTDPDNIVYAFAYDPHRDELIAGRSETEVRALFGYLRRPKDAGPWLRRCFEESDWKNSDARFIRDTDIIVIFENGRAKSAWIFKPC